MKRWKRCGNILHEKETEDSAPARSDNELCVGGVSSAFTVEIILPYLFSQPNYI